MIKENRRECQLQHAMLLQVDPTAAQCWKTDHIDVAVIIADLKNRPHCVREVSISPSPNDAES